MRKGYVDIYGNGDFPRVNHRDELALEIGGIAMNALDVTLFFKLDQKSFCLKESRKDVFMVRLCRPNGRLTTAP